jgi:iron-sulfur cluster insertion protein
MSRFPLGILTTEQEERIRSMSMFTVTDASQVFNLTDSAAEKVKSLIEAEEGDGLVLRVAVRPGGCSGLSYEMFFDTDVAADDVQHEQDGVKVVIDPASSPHLKGATLDYKDTLQGAGFSINNPNAERSCGCGQSFS